MADTIKLFYQGKRKIEGVTRDSTKKPEQQRKFVCLPGKPYEFDKDTGDYLKKLYASEFISAEDFQKQFDSLNGDVPQAAGPDAAFSAPIGPTPEEIDAMGNERAVAILMAAGASEEEARASVANFGKDNKGAEADAPPAADAPAGEAPHKRSLLERMTGAKE